MPEELVSYVIKIKNPEGNYEDITTLSAGQLSKIYINIMIDSKLEKLQNNVVILYDQPDNNLEKRFVYNTLGDKLIKLKKKYQVIITTHEPLLVVNSDSNSIIIANNDSRNGINSIDFKNLYLYAATTKESAIETIAELIDGSVEAIKLRNQIYDGGSYNV